MPREMGMQISNRVGCRIPSKTLYGRIRQELGEMFHDVAGQKDSRKLEAHLQPDQGGMGRVRGSRSGQSRESWEKADSCGRCIPVRNPIIRHRVASA